MKTQHILITGGAGFLGSHLSEAYLSKGYKVVAIDNLSTGFEKNINHLKKDRNFKFIKHDICKRLPEAVLSYDFDIIANLASPASPPQYQRLAVETMVVGSRGMINVLELARIKQARFFQASTSEVYGDPEVHPQPESYKGSVNCYGPRSMYDEAKRFAESLVYVYKNKYSVNTTIARFFNTYGPRMDPNDGRVVSNLIVQALSGKPMTIYGDGSQTRSFCYVDDLIKGIIAQIESNEEGPINLGNPGEFTIRELAKIIRDLTKTSSKVIFKPLPGDDPLQRQPVIDIAIEKLNWQPTVELKNGLIKTIDYFKQQ